MEPNLASLAERFDAVVAGAKSVLVGTHLNPDGDALGSALAVCHLLDSRGIPNELICNNLAPYNLGFLPGLDRLKLEAERSHDVGIVLDLDALHRLGRTQPSFEQCRELVIIDHHVPHEEPGTLRIVDVAAPATAVVLYRIIKQLGAPISPAMATCLMTGIVTDTGSFRYRNTTEESLHTVADLLAAGGDIVRIGEEVYGKRPLASLQLLNRCLDRMKISEDGSIAWSVLEAADFASTGALEQHTEGLVNELLSIDTVRVAAILRQPAPDKMVRASLRSRGLVDVATVAQKFGGGGHRNAAGITFDGSLARAEADLIAAVRLCLESS
ncbi:MAG: bifunctional oligoribonuclease/PAP phosphatase NrnA [Chthonomonas sp.]|nr:bifunctional oligoribonuclease/PAP phosphatase NrnA [Chthonomonas sp.]